MVRRRSGLRGIGPSDAERILESSIAAGRDMRRGGEIVQFLGELLLHDAAHFELDGSLFGNFDALQRLGVLRDPGRPNLALEDSEVAELESVALSEFVHDVIEKELDDPLDRHPLVAGTVGDSVDKLFLRDSWHAIHLIGRRMPVFDESASNGIR